MPSYAGARFAYILGAGASGGMPAGSNNQNAFMLGIAPNYLTSTALGRRPVAAYTNITAVAGIFSNRLTAEGAVLAPARIGPQLAFFPNRNGPTIFATSPY